MTSFPKFDDFLFLYTTLIISIVWQVSFKTSMCNIAFVICLPSVFPSSYFSCPCITYQFLKTKVFLTQDMCKKVKCKGEGGYVRNKRMSQISKTCSSIIVQVILRINLAEFEQAKPNQIYCTIALHMMCTQPLNSFEHWELVWWTFYDLGLAFEWKNGEIHTCVPFHCSCVRPKQYSSPTSTSSTKHSTPKQPPFKSRQQLCLLPTKHKAWLFQLYRQLCASIRTLKSYEPCHWQWPFTSGQSCFFRHRICCIPKLNCLFPKAIIQWFAKFKP